MVQFKLAEEKAAEWGVTTQHVQRLCRKGAVSGAVKRAGIWFIPDNTPNPAKNTKSDEKNFRFVGTKMRIFEQAIELFQRKGFENVSVQDIAEAAGIRQSAVYNHFKSKLDILNTIYDFYQFYFLESRPSIDDLEPIMREGSLYDIIKSVRYDFAKEIEEKMLNISRIVYQRKCTDERARQLAKELTIEQGTRFVEEAFQRAIDIGRIAPMDVHLMGVFVNGIRVYTMHSWVVDPSIECMTRIVTDEHALYLQAAKLLTDLKPPGTDK